MFVQEVFPYLFNAPQVENTKIGWLLTVTLMMIESFELKATLVNAGSFFGIFSTHMHFKKKKESKGVKIKSKILKRQVQKTCLPPLSLGFELRFQ